MKLHPRYEWHIFHILTSQDIADVIPLFFLFFFFFHFRNTHICVIKRKLHVDLNILFFPLQDKLHMFAPPCNILYLFYSSTITGTLADCLVHQPPLATSISTTRSKRPWSIRPSVSHFKRYLWFEYKAFKQLGNFDTKGVAKKHSTNKWRTIFIG